LDGKTDKTTRQKIVDDFARGKYKVLHNVALFTEGFDIPDTEVVILNRATKSLGLYVQMVGRGLRPIWNDDYTDHAKDEFGNYIKPSCIVLDHGGNTMRHGFVEDYDGMPFDLNSIKKRYKQKEEEDIKHKACLKCDSLNFIQARVCKHCEEPFPIKEKEVKFAEGISFYVLERHATIIERLKQISHKDVHKTVPASQLRLYGALQGHKPMWWFHQAIDGNYVEGVSKQHPQAFNMVITLLEMAEVTGDTHELYKSIKEQKTIKN
jgi:ribosomal protein L40E